MTITPEVIAAYKELVLNPQKNGLPIDSLTDCFEKSETVTAKHILAESYINHINKPLPKVILYIIMNDVFGQCDGRDERKCLGYHLRFTK